MCQLLGMNCNVPTDIIFSFSGFQARGGQTDVHKDGFGIAFFEGRGVRLFLDPQPSAQSPVAELIRSYPIKSKNVVSHIRKATQGEINLENTHPFVRELWGRYWIFAHNGDLKDFKPELDGSYRPVGTTDSELAFAYIMQELRKTFPDYPGSETLFQFMTELTKSIGARGVFNFLFSNGEFLFAHCSTKLSYIVRQAPFSTARLKDREMTVDFSSVTTEIDRVAVIATQPLTDNETWTTLEPGTLWFFRDGIPTKSAKTIAGVEKEEACKT